MGTAALQTEQAKEKTAARDSAFELLRILCMLLIIAHHYSVHADWLRGQGIHTVRMLHGWSVFVQALALGGKWSCDVFMLITGYFSAGRKVNYKSTVRLAVEMYFYALVILGLAAVFAPGSITPQILTESLLPLLWGNWYCVCYLIFSLFIPFLNTLLEHLDRAGCKRLAGITLLLWSVLPWLFSTLGSDIAWAPADIMAFFAMYLCGAYIRLHVPERPQHRWRWALAAAAANLLLLLAMYTVDRIGVATHNDGMISWASYFVSLNGPLHVACALTVFMAFRGWQFHSRWVNWAAASVLGVYLIHDNSIIRPLLWNCWSPNDKYFLTPWLPLHAVIKILAVFTVCVVIDKGREWLFARSVDKWLDAWWSKHRKSA